MARKTPLVTRSNPPPVKDYTEYRPVLRRDFVWSCAYCTTTEAESMAVNFTIDHYEPKASRPDLVNDFRNLMYACNACNILKAGRVPTAEGRAAGYRFYRADEDYREDHFRLSDLELKPVSNTGSYTIDAIDLNRPSLQRIRSLRRRLRHCAQLVSAGVMALKNFPIDRLPQELRGTALRQIRKAMGSADKMKLDIDELLEAAAKSNLIDPDPDSKKRAKERSERIRESEGLFAGNWSRATTKKRRRA